MFLGNLLSLSSLNKAFKNIHDLFYTKKSKILDNKTTKDKNDMELNTNNYRLFNYITVSQNINQSDIPEAINDSVNQILIHSEDIISRSPNRCLVIKSLNINAVAFQDQGWKYLENAKSIPQGYSTYYHAPSQATVYIALHIKKVYLS